MVRFFEDGLGTLHQDAIYPLRESEDDEEGNGVRYEDRGERYSAIVLPVAADGLLNTFDTKLIKACNRGIENDIFGVIGPDPADVRPDGPLFHRHLRVCVYGTSYSSYIRVIAVPVMPTWRGCIQLDWLNTALDEVSKYLRGTEDTRLGIPSFWRGPELDPVDWTRIRSVINDRLGPTDCKVFAFPPVGFPNGYAASEVLPEPAFEDSDIDDDD